MITYITVVLLSFITGCLIGRRQGEKIGYRQGIAEAPLLLRQKSLEEGQCLLCTSKNINKY